MIRLTARNGMTLAAVLVAAFLALSLWSHGHARLLQVVAMEERVQQGGVAAEPAPDLGDALSRVIACLKVQTPPAAPCKLAIGVDNVAQNLNQRREFTVNYTDQGSGVYQVTITAGNNNSNPCPSCDTAAGPPGPP